MRKPPRRVGATWVKPTARRWWLVFLLLVRRPSAIDGFALIRPAEKIGELFAVLLDPDVCRHNILLGDPLNKRRFPEATPDTQVASGTRPSPLHGEDRDSNCRAPPRKHLPEKLVELDAGARLYPPPRHRVARG